ncbi:MAG: glycerophosphodiester phosphodiesterase [Hyphomicrobiaceae bacterium]
MYAATFFVAAVFPGKVLLATDGHRVELHGHRGARGLLPENSLIGFREAIRLGVDCLELDVGQLRDGEVVIHHDRTLNPDVTRKNGSWIDFATPLANLTKRDLESFDIGRLRPGTRYAARFAEQSPVDGARIPLLRELLAMPQLGRQPEICLNIEIKTSPEAHAETSPPEDIAKALLEILDEYNYRSRSRVQSFDWRGLLYLRQVAPDLALSFLTAERDWLDNLMRLEPGLSPWLAGIDLAKYQNSAPRAIKAAGGQTWAPYYHDLTPQELAEAKSIGLKVIVWTVNDEADMRNLLTMGVDGIITDYPDLGRQVIDSLHILPDAGAN